MMQQHNNNPLRPLERFAIIVSGLENDVYVAVANWILNTDTECLSKYWACTLFNQLYEYKKTQAFKHI